MEYPIKIIREETDEDTLTEFLNNPFKELIKFVVDVERGIIAFGGELHSDAAEILIKDGSNGNNLWGGNLYPLKEEDQIEYSSLINIKPSQDNYSIDIQKQEIVQKINEIMKKLIRGK
ncbi:hypothetical protein KAR26_02945 [Candidatus Parcubacteria bacterium]|nr:hypothetical protein [Candidatus Parcubacteria bacterium]